MLLYKWFLTCSNKFEAFSIWFIKVSYCYIFLFPIKNGI